MHHLSRLRPFAVPSDVLNGVPTDEGVEYLALARSKENRPSGPRIDYLETADQAYALADGVSDAVWDEAVNWALDNPESFKMVLERSYRAWVAGDFEEVDLISSYYTRNRFAEIKHAVIAERNRLWIPTIRELVQSANTHTLVLVGAAHLGGPDGLVSQLAADGLRLTKC
ncbi:MAG: TraB/GumN family protein [Gammaproteobacteria bacterium]|nr:TraB/GumN family protein [Gammaproteobacteria bacterium]